ALATFLFLLLRQYYWGIVFIFLWSGLVSFSRIYLGVHYPGDVLVGALIGIVFAMIFYLILHWIMQKGWLGFKKTRRRKRVVKPGSSPGKRPPGRPRKVNPIDK
ncbi:MAG: phosphatase PAP2 family protein, partial [Cyclobacteriaceae bacterium]